MSAAHTPGPWRTNLQAFPVEEGGDDELEISIEGSNPYQRTIAATFKTDGFTAPNDDEIVGCSLEEAKANARLIAAAPELLEALTLLLHEVDESAIAGAKDYGWPNAVAKSRAAIAKATGENHENG